MNKYALLSIALVAVLVFNGSRQSAAPVVVDERDQWAVDFLAAIGNGSPDAATMAFVVAWQASENTAAAFNPLATTQPMPGDSCFNYLEGKCGVRNYVDRAQGIEASATTIRNGRYPNMLAGLVGNDPERALDAGELGTWGTGVKNVEALYRSAPPASTSGGDMDVRVRLVQTAMTQLGKPYLLGAASYQTENFDCSSFVQWAYGEIGVKISRTTYSQQPELMDIASEDLLPGDLIYQQWPTDQHVLMWAGDVDGDGLGDAVNAGGYRQDVNVISNFFGDGPMVGHIISFKRVLR